MITKEQIRRTRRAVAGMQPPVLSIYLQIDQANPHEARVRARSTMAALGVPDEIQRKAMSVLEPPENRSPTLAIFANDTALDVVGLPFELPVIDPRTGRVEARWGEPYSAPLLLALDQHERFAVVLIARDRCRTFEVYLGEIEELGSRVRPEPPGVDVRPENRQSFPAFIPSRDDAARDRFERKELEGVRRFFESYGDELDDLMTVRGIGGLIVLGPDRALSLFGTFASRQVSDRIAAMEQGLPDPEAPASAVLDRVAPIIERLETQRTERVLDEAGDEGARGVEKVLAELQHGRLHTVVAPWLLDGEVYETADGYVALDEESAKKAAGDGDVRRVPLKAVLPDLASAYGARLTYAWGANEARVLALGGMCGLLRW